MNDEEMNESPWPNVRRFEQRHGKSYAHSNGWDYFEDGAQREICSDLPSGFGLLREPDHDPYKRAKDVCTFWEIKLHRVLEKAEDLKRGLLEMQKAYANAPHRSAPPPNSEAEEAQLKALQIQVRRARRRLEKAEQAVEKSKPVKMIRRAENDLEYRDLAAANYERIKNISL